MDRPTLQLPILHPLLREVAESERLRELAQALPTRARVSESALPLVVAALYEELARGLVVLTARGRRRARPRGGGRRGSSARSGPPTCRAGAFAGSPG